MLPATLFFGYSFHGHWLPFHGKSPATCRCVGYDGVLSVKVPLSLSLYVYIYISIDLHIYIITYIYIYILYIIYIYT